MPTEQGMKVLLRQHAEVDKGESWLFSPPGMSHRQPAYEVWTLARVLNKQMNRFNLYIQGQGDTSLWLRK